MYKYDQNTPILLLVYNRPELTAQVFKRIKNAAPKKLYVAADGAKNETEVERCNQVKQLVSEIDWDCELKTLFRTKNLGCGNAVSKGITWFFEQEENGIILEDDCLPDDSFFGFCSYMLDFYNGDERIGHISGSNFQDQIKRGTGSYYFSELTHVWGWAGWKRVWKDYDFKITSYNEFDKNFNAFPAHKPFSTHWNNIFSAVAAGEINTWDYQYAFLNLIKGYKSIMPSTNLVKNIGLGKDGTHTTIDHPLAVNTTQSAAVVNHPKFFIQDVEADIYTQEKEFYIQSNQKSLLSKAWKAIKEKL